MKEIYFDNSATTRPTKRCIDAVCEMLSECYANPSSLHSLGYSARKRVEKAREDILATLGTDTKKHRLIFTASGSEANNLAILGVAHSKKWRFKPKMLLSEGEHPSVTNTARALEAEGFELVYIPTVGGEIDIKAIEMAADERVVLCSFMMVNNETGAHYDVKRAFAAVRAKAPDAVCHTDCVQAYMRVPINPTALGADLVSISAHKVHGPKGIGALLLDQRLFVRKLISPVVFGGGQEYEMRAGTENSAYIVGFAEAAIEAKENMQSFWTKAGGIYEYVKAALECEDGFVINEPKARVPYIISITAKNIKSETMLHFLSSEGIYVSSGSACSSHSKHTSPALSAFGLDAETADMTVRVSLCRDNTIEEAQSFVEALKKGAQTLVGIKKQK